MQPASHLKHPEIYAKLEHILNIQKIPNIVFHGPSGSGKKTIVSDFIHMIYANNKEHIKNHVMSVNCAHGKGIKFIREDLKFFAKSHIHACQEHLFKCIVLMNADKLTNDAQSALRRCIELFSQTTRFFIILEDKYKLLKPILSRFSEIYIPEPIIDGMPVNLYKYNIQMTYYPSFGDMKTARCEWLEKQIIKLKPTDILLFATKIYEKGYSALDLIETIENDILPFPNKDEFLFAFQKIKREIRNEKLLIIFILQFATTGSFCFENISTFL